LISWPTVSCSTSCREDLISELGTQGAAAIYQTSYESLVFF